MGATHVTVTIRNPADPDRAWEGLFLVDTGATDSLVPRPHLEAIGLRPKGRRVSSGSASAAPNRIVPPTVSPMNSISPTVTSTVTSRSRPDQPTAEATPRGTAQAPAGTGLIMRGTEAQSRSITTIAGDAGC